LSVAVDTGIQDLCKVWLPTACYSALFPQDVVSPDLLDCRFDQTLTRAMSTGKALGPVHLTFLNRYGIEFDEQYVWD